VRIEFFTRHRKYVLPTRVKMACKKLPKAKVVSEAKAVSRRVPLFERKDKRVKVHKPSPTPKRKEQVAQSAFGKELMKQALLYVRRSAQKVAQ
jgi:hypothetical protein